MKLTEKLELCAGTATLLSGSVLYFYLLFQSYLIGGASEGLSNFFWSAIVNVSFMIPSGIVGIGTHYDLWRKDNTGYVLLIVGNLLLVPTLLNPGFLIAIAMEWNIYFKIGMIGPVILAPLTLLCRYIRVKTLRTQLA